jgi:hypothetical protein
MEHNLLNTVKKKKYIHSGKLKNRKIAQIWPRLESNELPLYMYLFSSIKCRCTLRFALNSPFISEHSFDRMKGIKKLRN